MCFAPQLRSLFRHLNFKKCSELEVLLAFSLANVLRATMACNFFISHLPSGLRTRRFSEPTFRPSGATNHWKNTVCRDFPTFSRTWIFFLLRFYLFDLLSSSLLLLFSSLTLPISAFHMSILSEVWLLNFLRSLLCIYGLLYTNICILFSCWITEGDPPWRKPGDVYSSMALN